MKTFELSKDATFTPEEDKAQRIIDAVKSRVRDSISNHFYLNNAERGYWPTVIGTASVVEASYKVTRDLSLEQTLHSYKLKRRAVQSFDFDLDDSAQHDSVIQAMSWIVIYVLETAFRNDIAGLSENRIVVREFSDDLIRKDMDREPTVAVHESMPRRVNFFGKSVPPYLSMNDRRILNPKYIRAAKQIIGWHPRIATFLFSDLDNWLGDFRILTLGGKSFLEVQFQYAACPQMTHLGYVITVVPEGLRGFLWYWAWKLFRFVP